MTTEQLDAMYAHGLAHARRWAAAHDPEEIYSLVHIALADAGFDVDPDVQRRFIRRYVNRYVRQVTNERERRVQGGEMLWDRIVQPTTALRDHMGWPNARNQNKGKTVCKRGHPLHSPNVYITPSTGARMCCLCTGRKPNA